MVPVLRLVTEVNCHKVLGCVKLLDQHCVVKELVSLDFNKSERKGSNQEPEELTLRAGAGKDHKAFVNARRTDRKKWNPPQVD